MNTSPKPSPSQAILQLGPDFYDPVRPAQFPQGHARFLNKSSALALNLKLDSEADWKKHFVDFEPLPGNLPEPLALRYHGHQFRHYNPELGDGRGFLFAQFETHSAGGESRLLDLGTKGSGQTPWSRSGDGRLTLKGAVREALATEQLESLGVNTSKTFCFFETGEKLERNDEPSPTRAAVLTRLNHSHIRFGTFQRLAYFNQTENIKKLVSYSLQHYFAPATPIHTQATTDDAALFLQQVSDRSAKLVAEWMIAGFVHGVLNTDNMNITGESFDYGPYRFLPSYEPNFTAAYFDQQGLYCFGHQPNSVFWNVQQLAASLLKAYPDLDISSALKGFGDIFSESVSKIFLTRLNLKVHPAHNSSAIESLLTSFYQALEVSQSPFEQTCFDFFGGLNSPRIETSPQRLIYQQPIFSDLHAQLKKFTVADPEKMNHSYFQRAEPCTLLIEEIESLWSAIANQDDWAPFENKIAEIRSFRGLYSSPRNI